jgi:hypothetical protein
LTPLSFTPNLLRASGAGGPPREEVSLLLDPDSLSRTIDAVNDAMFGNRKLPAAERTAVARFIAARQGLPGAYADTFAGFDEERRRGIVVFTGERITSASSRHILGEEACRALRLLRVRDATVQGALGHATEGLMGCLGRAARDPRNTNPGRYCCGKCTVGLWRNLLAGGLDRQEERLRRGVEHLRTTRDGEGTWRVFPSWYTVLALAEMDLPEAVAELRYAAPMLEKIARRTPLSAVHARRRHELAVRALARL